MIPNNNDCHPLSRYWSLSMIFVGSLWSFFFFFFLPNFDHIEFQNFISRHSKWNTSDNNNNNKSTSCIGVGSGIEPPHWQRINSIKIMRKFVFCLCCTLNQVGKEKETGINLHYCGLSTHYTFTVYCIVV